MIVMKYVDHFMCRRTFLFRSVFQACIHSLASITNVITANLQQRKQTLKTNREEATTLQLLQECINTRSLERGKLVHTRIIKTGHQADVFLASKLVIMYAKCRSLEDACYVFDKMPEQTLVAWNAILGGYAQNGRLEDARKVFDSMPERNVVSWTTMIAGLVQGRRLADARMLFDKMPERNVVSWTAMIVGYSQNGDAEESLELFYQMQQSGTRPNQFTFNSVLSTCASLGDLELSNVVYGQIIKMGLESELSVGNALVNLYVKLGGLDRASQVFDKMPERDVYSWTALVTGYAQNGRTEDARQLFDKMPERCMVSWSAMIAGYSQNDNCEDALNLYVQMLQAGVKPNQSTLASVLSACGALGGLEEGIQFHAYIIKTGFESDVFARSALLDMYAKCGNMECAKQAFVTFRERNTVSWNSMIAGYAQNRRVEEAFEFFTDMPERNLVSWNSMIAAYCQNEQAEKALELFAQMQKGGSIPDQYTFTSVLSACASMAAMEQGMQTHAKIIGCGLVSDVLMGSALIDMYAKCGSIEYSRYAFDKMHTRNVVSWTVIILGYAQHGHGKIALQLFDEMQRAGMKPNHVTFVGVLTGCNHAGLVDEGWDYFTAMSRDYQLTPREEHYACMVDLLCRAGHLDQAEKFIIEMPFQPDIVVWLALLSACRKYGKIDLGERTAERLFELEPENPSTYIMLSNMYAVAGRWGDVAKVSKVTHMCGAPVVLSMMANAQPSERKPLPGKVDILTAGAPPPAAILWKIEEMGFSVTHAYGLTETAGVVVSCAWKAKWDNLAGKERARLKARQGVRNLNLAELDVKDPATMASVARDGLQMGEVMVRGASVMKGYLKNEQMTALAMDGGWFRTGDVGVIHPDGYLEIKDRSKDIIISGGENISSVEVESVLYSHPLIVEAAVVARPDPFWGETPCAFVSIKNNDERQVLSEAQVISYCTERMAHFMAPKSVVFLQELPKTSTGKIKKYVLKEMVGFVNKAGSVRPAKRSVDSLLSSVRPCPRFNLATCPTRHLNLRSIHFRM